MLNQAAYLIYCDVGERVEVGNVLGATLAVAGRSESAARLLSALAAVYEELGTSQVWARARGGRPRM
jgi:hypothetical protein